MALFNEQVTAEIKEILAGMKGPVSVGYYTAEKDCPTCPQADTFIDELAAIDGRLQVERFDGAAAGAEESGIHHVPAFFPRRAGEERAAVRYFGVPGGHEFGVFLRTLVLCSTGDVPGEIEAGALAAVDRDVSLRLFVLTTCPTCPVMAYLCNSLALAHPRITTEIIEADTFLDLARKHAVGTVPKLIINDKDEIVGVLPAEELIRRITKPDSGS